MSHCVITGGAGFIGSNVADFYLSRQKRVTIVDNFSRPGSEKNLLWLKARYRKRLKVVAADIRNDDCELTAAMEGAEAVFHLAAQVATTSSVADPREDFEINALGTFNVLEAVRRSATRPILLYSSTSKVYGKPADLGIVERGGRYAYEGDCQGVSERRPLAPDSPYGCSKCAGDRYVLDYAHTYGLKTIVFRQSSIYGPRQFGREDQGWLAWFSIRAFQGRPVTIYGDGKQVRDVLYIKDLVEAYDAAVRNIQTTAGQAYNIGGGPSNTLSLLELVEMLDHESPGKLKCSFENWRPGDRPVFVSDIAKACADFGWRPATGVREGVAQLIEWIRGNAALFEIARPALVQRGAAG
jgi:CDP-paratose 2-epimerase